MLTTVRVIDTPAGPVTCPSTITPLAVGGIATCTLDWTGLCTGGAALTFSAAQAERVYADPRWAWLREQVLKALDTRELFFSTEPATAATTG